MDAVGTMEPINGDGLDFCGMNRFAFNSFEPILQDREGRVIAGRFSR